MFRKKELVDVLVECSHDSRTWHKYHGVIIFSSLKRNINAAFTFTAHMTPEDLHLVFYLKGTLVFEYHQKLPINEQLTDDEVERIFRYDLIQAALHGLKGPAATAAVLMENSHPGNDAHLLKLASRSIGTASYKLSIFSGKIKPEIKEGILQKLRDATS